MLASPHRRHGWFQVISARRANRDHFDRRIGEQRGEVLVRDTPVSAANFSADSRVRLEQPIKLGAWHLGDRLGVKTRNHSATDNPEFRNSSPSTFPNVRQNRCGSSYRAPRVSAERQG